MLIQTFLFQKLSLRISSPIVTACMKGRNPEGLEFDCLK